jgi:mannose-6-phosphate isomerase-like protein (cupin superfamily)
MKNTSNRREALQQIMMAAAGIGLFSMASCSSSKPVSGTAKSGDPLQPFYIPPPKPLEPGPGGLDIRTLIRSSQTNMQFSCVEFAVAPKKMGPAPHYHKELDELMYVLDGTATVMVEDKIYEIPAGGWHFRPHGKVHTFFNQTNESFRGIDMYFNQNFEDYLEEMIHQIIPDMLQHNLTPADPGVAKRMNDLQEKFGLVGFPEKRDGIIKKFGLIA